MAQEIFIDTHLDFAYSPLNVSYGIAVDGNVAAEQAFDQSDGTYLPDYTKTYCVMRAWMRIVDPDDIIESGPVQMTNQHWYVYDGTTETEITNGTDYQMSADGRISIRKNVDPGKTLILRFKGEYQDPRTGEVWKMEDTHPLSCEAESAPTRLLLNQPELTEWDPTSDDPQKIVLKSALLIGKDEVAAANRELIWEKKDEGDADFARIYRETDANYDILDYDVSLNSDGTELTLQRELMGHRVDIRVRAKYDPYGNPSGVALDDHCPEATATFTRNVPTPDVTVLSPKKFKPGQTHWQPEVEVYIGDRLIANPEKFWQFNWYLSRGVASGAISRVLVGEGLKPTLPTSYLAKTYGAVLQVGVVERDPLSALMDDGYVIVDDDGTIILG